MGLVINVDVAIKVYNDLIKKSVVNYMLALTELYTCSFFQWYSNTL